MSPETNKTGRKIRVLIVEDSIYMQYVISQILEEDGTFEVVGKARDGVDALEKIVRLNPDVITLDIQMPRMDGLEFLRENRRTHRVPCVVISSLTTEGAVETIRALELGAVDFIPKPSGIESLTLEQIRKEIIEKVKIAAELGRRKLAEKPAREIPAAALGKKKTPIKHKPIVKKAIAIGCSTGGPRALTEIIPALPSDLPAAIFVVQHMPPKFTRGLADRLDNLSAIHVVEAAHLQRIEGGTVYIAPGDYHMLAHRNGHITLNQDPPLLGVRPSIDLLMKSVADVFKTKALGILLTGMGSDGAAGLFAIREARGISIAEDESTAVVYGMPKVAKERGCTDKILPLDKIVPEILAQV
ncbi:MAG: chemotaxis response regulator protein-glutamate methylesterase [bacterium]